MKSASFEFKKKLSEGALLYPYAVITLSDGTSLTLDEYDFISSGNSISEGSSESKFPLGCAIAKTITISIDNSDDRYSSYDFYFARIRLSTRMQLDSGLYESVNEGYFTVINPETPGKTIVIDAVDDMYKADVSYAPSVTFPATLRSIANDVAAQSDLIVNPIFKNSDFVVNEAPSGLTCRSMFGLIAQIAGGNAVCNTNGIVIIKTYNASLFESAGIIDGGTNGEVVPNIIDGGLDGESVSDVIEAGTSVPADMHNLFNLSSQRIGTDDIVITGLSTIVEKDGEDEKDEEILVGIEGYTLKIENPLIKGNELKALNLIASLVVGLTLRPFAIDYVAYCIAEFMDPCYVWDADKNVYQSFITDIDFVYCDKTTLKNSSEGPLRNKSSYYSNATEAYRKAREGAAKQRGAWEKAIEDLADRLDGSSGLYTTFEEQPGGGIVFYLHDKKTVEQSQIVWKMTAEAWGVSTDGGETWNAGMTVDGDTIVRILTAVGVSAEWIRTGAFTLGGRGEDNPYMSILDESDSEIGRWDKNGIKADKGTIGSWIFDKYYFKAADGSSGIGFEDYIAFWAGGNIRDASFAVGKNGNASLKGDLALINDGNLRLVRDTQDVAVISSTTSLGSYSGKILNIASFQKGIGFSSGNSLAYVINGGINPGYTEKHLFYGAARFSESARTFSYYLGNSSARLAYATWSGGSVDGAILQGRFKVEGEFSASGSKSRIVNTENYSERLQYCYEMSTPMFGDIGESILDNDGNCYIFLDDIFSETVNTDCEYQVFLQKEGAGDLWVDAKESAFFIVKGTPNLKFAWEIKVKQRDFEFDRLETFDEGDEPEEKIDYESQAAQMVKKYYEDLEEMFYEESN